MLENGRRHTTQAGAALLNGRCGAKIGACGVLPFPIRVASRIVNGVRFASSVAIALVLAISPSSPTPAADRVPAAAELGAALESKAAKSEAAKSASAGSASAGSASAGSASAGSASDVRQLGRSTFTLDGHALPRPHYRPEPRPRAATRGTPPVGTVREWLGLDDTTGKYYRKNYTLRAVGKHIEVWVAQDLAFPAGDCRKDSSGRHRRADRRSDQGVRRHDLPQGDGRLQHAARPRRRQRGASAATSPVTATRRSPWSTTCATTTTSTSRRRSRTSRGSSRRSSTNSSTAT